MISKENLVLQYKNKLNPISLLLQKWMILSLYPEPENFMLTGNNRNQNFIDKKKDDPRGLKGLFIEIYLTQKRKDFI